MSRRPVRITTQDVEKNIKLQRDLDVRRGELAAFSKENANLISASNAQTKIELQRRLTQQNNCRTEQQYENSIQEKMYNNKIRQLTLTQNQALASELDKDSASEERKRREIQKICEEAPELRELERMLKIAYLNKERAAQYEEKILLATREQERIQAIEDQMEYERIKSIRQDSEKGQEKKLAFENQRAILQRQIDEKHEQLQEARFQMEQEKLMVDDIIRKINEEDQADYMQRKEKQAATAKMVRDFEEQRAREKAAARKAELDEEERIRQFNQLMESRSVGAAAKKQAKRDEEDRILKRIVEETERKRLEEEEFNNLRDMLWEEELEAKRSEDAKHRVEKQTKMKQEMMVANAQMMDLKQKQRLIDAENEARLVSAMRHKFALDEQRERDEEEYRKRMKQQHMSLIEQQTKDRKKMYEDERNQESRFAQDANEREEYRKRVVQEARKRLLEEHAARLNGFVTNKIFSNQEEYELFRAAAERNNY
eukprot:gene5311-7375_t